MTIKDKIKSVEEAVHWVNDQKYAGFDLVFTNGCFDLLHLGHVTYLEKASMLGDFLVVGLNSDESVGRLKGKERPINDEASRAHLLAAMDFVDLVVIFEEDTPLLLIEALTPDVLVKGGDYNIEQIVGASYIQDHGGVVATIPFIEGYSSSSIISKIRK